MISIVQRTVCAGGMFLLLLVSAFPSPARSEAVTIDGVAATVNGEVITLLDLEKAGRPLVEKRLATALKREHEKLRREVLGTVLDQLVLRTLQRQKAEEIGLRVSDGEIDGAIAQIMETNKLTDDMLERALAQEGLSREEYRKQISEQILFSKLMQREVRDKVTVAPHELEEYYLEHGEEYFQPEMIRVRHLLLPVGAEAGEDEIQEARNKAFQVLEEFKGGADFDSLVQRHSADASSGGETVSGWLKRGEFLAELEDIAFSLPVDQVSDPVRSRAGFHLIQVVEIREGGHLSLGAVEDSIRTTLMRGKMESEYESWLEKLRNESQVEIIF